MENKQSSQKLYHHGDLKEALIDATLSLIAERGLDQVTVAEAGKIVGVSIAAPYRHFPTKKDLMAAVADRVQDDLATRVLESLEPLENQEPWVAIRDLGFAYIHWALDRPAHFLVMNSRHYYTDRPNEKLLQMNASLRRLIDRALGHSPPNRMESIIVLTKVRCLLLGLVTVYCTGEMLLEDLEGKFPRELLEATWLSFVEGLMRSS